MENKTIQKIKNVINVIGVLKARQVALQDDLDFFQESNDGSIFFEGGLKRLEHEAMLLCIDAYSFHQGMWKQRSFFTKVIKQNSKNFVKIDKSKAVVDEDSFAYSGTFEKYKQGDITKAEVDSMLEHINQNALNDREKKQEEVGIDSHQHPQLDYWKANFLDQENLAPVIENIGKWRDTFAHRLDSFENLGRELKTLEPEDIETILTSVCTMLISYEDLLCKILGYSTAASYQVISIPYRALSELKRTEGMDHEHSHISY